MEPTVHDVDEAIYKAYRFLRSRRGLMAGQAYSLYKRWTGPNAPTYMVASDGTVIPVSSRYALLAELRILMLSRYPVGFVAKFDLITSQS